QSESEASVANLDLSLSGNAISADFLMARARAECQGGSASVSGSSEIAALTVNGQNVVVSGQPNQTVAVGPVTVVINEQQAFVDGDFGDITVNALHVTVRDPLTVAVLAEVVVSDNGEPGRSDTFSISLSNGYTASGKLAGGNIRLHTP